MNEKFERLEAELSNLRSELESNEAQRRNLAVMNALLAEKLNKEDDEIENEQAITELFRSNLEYLKGDKASLLATLKELKFSSEEQQEVFDSVFAEINKVAEELEDREQDLDELEELKLKNESEIEQKNYEISKLTLQLEDAEKKSKKKQNPDEIEDDVVAMDYVLNVNDQE